MLKKIIAFSLIIFANIILLVHAIIPHHHHQSEVCIEKVTCHDDESTHKNKTTERNNHHDDNSSNSISCILKQAFIIPSSQENNIKTNENTSLNQTNLFIQLNSENNYFIPCIEITKYKSYLYNYFISYKYNSINFRAPPIG